MELASRKTKEAIVAARGMVYNSDAIGQNEGGRIFIYAQLCPELKQLRWKAKQKAKEMNWKFVWVKNGYLYAKKSEESSRPLIIGSETDLAQIR